MTDGRDGFKTQLKAVVLRTLSGLRMLKIFNPLTRGTVSIFMLHRMENDACGIHGHTASRISEELEYLRRHKYNVISLEDAFNKLQGNSPLLENAVAFTMDDGYYDQADEAAELFLKFNAPLTIFVITGFLDGLLWPWDAKAEYVFNTTKRKKFTLTNSGQSFHFHCDDKNERRKSLKQYLYCVKHSPQDRVDDMIHNLSVAADVDVPGKPPAQYRPLSWDVARKLESTGGVRFGAHGVSHRTLSRLSADIAKYEIQESWSRVSAELSSPLDVFCYPIGRVDDYGQREIDVLKKTGFRGAVTAQDGYANFKPETFGTDEKFMQPRFSFPDNHEDFIQYSTGIEKIKSLLRIRSYPTCKSFMTF